MHWNTAAHGLTYVLIQTLRFTIALALLRRWSRPTRPYRAMDFDKARRLALAYSDTAALGSDVAAWLYADRCAALLAKPPPTEWEPTLVLTEKWI